MASCLVPDSSAVMVVLEHLRDLDKHLKEEGVSFTSEASHHLGEITAAITELEATRRALHEELEVETIENSKLRHQIHNIRERISQEIMADVAAARACNAEEMEQLQKDLNTISQLHEATVKRQEALVGQNAALQPEREQVRAEHENDIVALNDQMSQKSSMQIQLNQTLNQVEELKTCIATVNQNKITLQQSMILEKESFTVTKDSLLREVDQITEKIQQQRQENGTHRTELDRANSQQQHKHEQLSELTNQMAQLESRIGRLTASKCQCEKQLKEEIQMHQDLVQQTETLEKDLCHLRESFSTSDQHLKKDIIMVDCEVEEGRAMRSVCHDSLAKVSERFKSQQRERNDARADHLNVSRRLERSKLRLEEGIASIAKHRMEIREMKEQIRQLVETNITSKGLFQKNCEDMNSQLEAAKKSISQFEVEKGRLSWCLEEVQREQEEQEAKVSSDISSTRRRHQELQRQEVELQQHQSMSSEIDTLTSHVAQAELDRSQLENSRHQELQQLAAESELVVRSNEEKQREVEEKEEVLKEVEAKFEKEQSQHQRLEQLTSELKSRKKQLELSIQGLKENTSSLLQPKEEMKAELEAMRTRYIDLLANQASELRSVEMSIYDKGVKLERVNMENSRMHLCVAQMKEDIASAREDKDRYLKEICWLRKEVNGLFERLQEAWREDLVFTQECQGSDAVVLESMGVLVNQLQTRKLQLGNANTYLQDQLFYVSKLLGNKT